MTTIRLNKHQLAELLGVEESMARKTANAEGWLKHQDNHNSPSEWDIPITYFESRGIDVSGYKIQGVNGLGTDGNIPSSADVNFTPRVGNPVPTRVKTTIPVAEQMGIPDGNCQPYPVIGWEQFSSMNLSDLYCLYIKNTHNNVRLEAENRAAIFEVKTLQGHIALLEKEIALLKTIINDKQHQLGRLEPLADRLIDKDLLGRPVNLFEANKKPLSSMIRTLINASNECGIDYVKQAIAIYHLAKILPPEQFEPFASLDVDGLMEFIASCRDNGYSVSTEASDAAVSFIKRVQSAGQTVVNLASVRGGKHE